MTWPAPLKRMPSQRDYAARQHYERDGWTVVECAAFLGLSKAQARVRLVRVGTAMRPRGHRSGVAWRKAA